MSGYFERIEHHLLDAVERPAATRERLHAPCGHATHEPTASDSGTAGVRATARATRARTAAARAARTAAARATRARTAAARAARTAAARATRARPARARATGRPARTRVATATGLVALVAIAAVAALWGGGAPPEEHAARDRPGTLPALLGVLRRDQRAGDAPPRVVAAARAAARRADPPYRGTVEAAAVRRVAAIPAAGGHRVYLAPVQPAAGTAGTGGDSASDDGEAAGATAAADRSAASPTAALVILTDARDRPVQYPYGVTRTALGDGRAWYVAWGLRAGPGDHDDRDDRDDGGRMRSLQVQLVPDGVASVAYRYPAERYGPSRSPERTVRVTVTGNAAATVLRGSLASRYPGEAVLRDGAGEVVDRAVPVVRGRGPVAPAAVCRGAELPARPSGRPRIGIGAVTLRELCEQAGLPQRAYRRDSDYVLALFADGTVVGAPRGDAISSVWHMEPGGSFPPSFTDLLPPAKKLGHYPARPSDRRSP
ncbi:hypothetical protein [Conexibacter arvalis]|uniref:Uncharacterized protein n=1 Tax=Conexibacter arvalis TaxID=912552 RepID=A0A840IJI2_9ACTN|nr:hypothetical protein [Conexibacter arvalis]MBB4664184.1 hypothetical protein [Conexibacter arvalis]